MRRIMWTLSGTVCWGLTTWSSLLCRKMLRRYPNRWSRTLRKNGEETCENLYFCGRSQKYLFKWCVEPAKLFKRLCSRIWSSSTCTGTKLERGKTLYYIPSETFVKSRGTAGVYVVGTKLVVNLCTERVNLRNFWGGRWKSRWEVDLTADPGVVKGTIELHVHYFENETYSCRALRMLKRRSRLNIQAVWVMRFAYHERGRGWIADEPRRHVH